MIRLLGQSAQAHAPASKASPNSSAAPRSCPLTTSARLTTSRMTASAAMMTLFKSLTGASPAGSDRVRWFAPDVR
jgi:hypothetical protein